MQILYEQREVLTVRCYIVIKEVVVFTCEVAIPISCFKPNRYATFSVNCADSIKGMGYVIIIRPIFLRMQINNVW